MRERLKTLLLLALLLCSLVLTGRLLFGVPLLETAAPPAYEKLTFGELRPPDRQILPTLRLGTQQLWPWSPGYDKAWESVRQLLSQSRDTGLERQEKPRVPEDGNHLLVQFPRPVPPELWGGLEQIKAQAVSAIYWQERDPAAIWYREERGDWLQVRSTALSAVEPGELRDVFTGAPSFQAADRQEWATLGLSLEGEILLPVTRPALSPRFVTPEELDINKLLRSIFLNLALVRRIEEQEGAVIYTDGQRGLRLFDHGEVEFSAPKSEPGLEEMALLPALRRTAQYLQLMGGWPEHLFVGQIVPEVGVVPGREGEAYKVTFFSAQQGVRLLGPEPPVRLRFSDRGVISYNRQVRILGDKAGQARPLISPLVAALSVRKALGDESNALKLREVFPAYYVQSPVSQHAVSPPVWAFVFSDGRTAIVHGHSGSFLAWQQQ